MKFEGKIVFVTGAGRGIGKAFVHALLEKNVKKVFASAIHIESVAGYDDDRVVAVELDITNRSQILEAGAGCGDTQILINNAGVLHAGSILEGDLEGFKKDMEVNFFAQIEMMRAFAPLLAKNKDARIVNIASIASYVSFPFIAGYSASKAALYSASQAARIELSQKDIKVHIVYPGAIDTDMNKGSQMKMTPPLTVARDILDAVEHDIADIVPDHIGKGMYDVWRRSPADLEELSRQMYFGEAAK